MLGFSHDVKIYLCLGHTDMRKGVHGLALLASSLIKDDVKSSNIIVFRGKSADKIKILWWDGQGFCLFYKCFDSGKFVWPNTQDKGSIGVTKAQLSMLIEGVDWRNPRWSKRPHYTG